MRAATRAQCIRRVALGFSALVIVCAHAQQPRPIGTVAAANATISNPGGVIKTSTGTVSLTGTNTVSAKDHTASISLARGGTVAVCRSSVLHITAAATSSGTAPLLLAIDKGALEVQMQSAPGDVLLTPDLRLTTPTGGPLDLALDVTASGDTCINNRGPGAPVISVTDAFGETTYQVKPDQHILFEHGDLHAVVDRETTPCGCPPDEKPSVSIAEALLASQGQMTADQSRAAHPFPDAVSRGLAQPAPVPPETPDTHVQVATTLTYDPSAPPPPTEPDATPEPRPRVAPKRGEVKPKNKPAPAPPKIKQPSVAPTAPQIATLGSTAPPPMTALQPSAPPPQVRKSAVPRPLRAIGRFLKRVFID